MYLHEEKDTDGDNKVVVIVNKAIGTHVYLQ